jgi:glucose-1-phosphate adenylyltransferase
MRNIIALVLGGGRGTRLYPLTKYRAKPAVPLAAKYRLIDIPLSNCLNSGINRIYVLTQFLSASLHRHTRQSYRFDQFSGGFVELLAAQQTMEEGALDWYQGTADAVRKNLRYIQQPGIEHVLILSGDQLYRMNYDDMLRTHLDKNADVTIGAMPVTRDAAKSLGVMRADDDGRVEGFLEKPKTDEEIDLVKMDPRWIDKRGIPSKGRDCLASMGIYIFKRETLVDALDKTPYHDFGKEIFPASVRSKNVQVHLFDGYWEDIGTIRAFFECNLSLVGPNPQFDFADPSAPIFTRARFLPPSRLEGATVNRSWIAEGCEIGQGAVIENSLIGVRCKIGSGVTIRNSYIMGNDYFETDEDRKRNLKAGTPPIGIGAGSMIKGAIIDKNVRIGRNVWVVNENGLVDGEDNDQCVVRDGIPCVIKDAVLPDAWKLG